MMAELKVEQELKLAAEEYAYNPESPRESNSRDSWVDPEAAFIAGAQWQSTRPALSPTTGEAHKETYAQFQQRRGRLPDLIEEAIGIYDGFMKDDDYDSQRCLDRVVERLRSARDWYASAALPLAPREGWQEISTALDNGGNFLVGWIGRPTVTIATFNAAGRLVELEDFSGWIEGGEPTHWQPLPAAPAALSRTGEMSRG